MKEDKLKSVAYKRQAKSLPIWNQRIKKQLIVVFKMFLLFETLLFEDIVNLGLEVIVIISMKSTEAFLPPGEQQLESISANTRQDTYSHSSSSSQTDNANIFHLKYALYALLLMLFILMAFVVGHAKRPLPIVPSTAAAMTQEESIKKQQLLMANRQIRIRSLDERQRQFFLIRKQYQARKELVLQLDEQEQLDVLNELANTKYELQTAKLNLDMNAEELQIMENGRNDRLLILPNLLWIYLSKPLEEQTYINQLTIKNNQQRAKDYNITCHILTQHNHAEFLSKELSSQLNSTIGYVRSLKSLSEEVMTQLNKYAVLTAVLEQQGGIFMDQYVSLLENFDWIKNINNNIFVDRGNKFIDGQVVTFHSAEYSSPLERQKKEEIYRVKQYSRILPAIQHFFIAAQPRAAFIVDLRKELLQNLRKGEQDIKFMAYFLHENFKVKEYDDVWSHLLMISAQRILANKQQQLAEGTFAVDHYRLKTINKDYFPNKLEAIFTKYQYQKSYAQLARLPREQLQAEIGPLRYIVIIIPRNWVDSELRSAKEGKREYYVVNGSFMQFCLFPKANEQFIIPNPENPYQLTNAPEWSKLPKVIWLFWDKGIAESHATNQLAKRNIEQFAYISGFRVIEVNKTNLRQYINKNDIQRIEEALYFNNRGGSFKQTYSDLVRLALLIKHGGVYMDASYVLLQSLDWLVNIASYPSQYVFNRYGKVPEVFMFFNPQYGGVFEDWQVDPEYNTKAHWHLSYQNNFIAAEPESELMIQWFDNLINYLTQPYDQTEQQFRKCGILNHKWSSQENTYLLPMDALKCVIGKKEKQLTPNSSVFSPASEYYKIWSINGYNGVQKFRSFTNFENRASNDNYFFRRYSQYYISQVIGRPRELVKLYSESNQALNQFLLQSLQQDVFREIHLRSYFNKYLFSFRLPNETFIVKGGNLKIKSQ